MRVALVVLILGLGPAGWALGQSSSLFLESEARRAETVAATTRPAVNGALPTNAGAILPSGTQRNVVLAQASLTALATPEPKVLKVNDFIGVVIRYRLRHQSTSKMKQDTKWDANAKLAAWFRIHDGNWQQQGFRGGVPETKFNTKNKLDNKGQSDRSDVFETRLMAKVVDVKPNGNLIVVGWSRMQIDDEEQYLRMSGECHKDQISPDGTIASDKIFGLEVETMNEGAVKDAVKRGWFKEMMDGVKPF